MASEHERLRTRGGSSEQELERSLRPRSLASFVGQPVLRELGIFIAAAPPRVASPSIMCFWPDLRAWGRPPWRTHRLKMGVNISTRRGRLNASRYGGHTHPSAGRRRALHRRDTPPQRAIEEICTGDGGLRDRHRHRQGRVPGPSVWSSSLHAHTSDHAVGAHHHSSTRSFSGSPIA